MDGFWDFAGNFWWLIFAAGPIAATVGGVLSSSQKRRDKRRREKHEFELERLRIQQGVPRASTLAAPASSAPIFPDLSRVLAQHDAVSRRWLDHELDAAKVIDFPLMTDMREPLTRDFHRAKRKADALRPEDGDEPDAALIAEYRDAVERFEDAFEVALAEARRRAQHDFTDVERKRLQTARMLVGIAIDEAASSAERQSAYRRARAELDGLIVLPDATAADIEQRIAGAIGRGTTRA